MNQFIDKGFYFKYSKLKLIFRKLFMFIKKEKKKGVHSSRGAVLVHGLLMILVVKSQQKTKMEVFARNLKSIRAFCVDMSNYQPTFFKQYVTKKITL